MLFNSFHFVVFFPLVVIGYFCLPLRWRRFFLLIASYYFYACWKIEYLGLIIFSTLVDYVAGVEMEQHNSRSVRRLCLAASLLANLGLLFVFKYFNFVNDSVRELFNHFNVMYNAPALRVLLPVGISFYTFQTLSYTIDVYRGDRKAEHNVITFAVYVAFFPQLVAGPIERSTHLMPQFNEQHDFCYSRVCGGLKLIIWGFFKKLVIADRLAVYVNSVYNHPESCSGASVLLATYFFAFQIYCDFSGYSDIAIGSAQILGFDLMENFRRPYLARNIREFWGRWHISLSTWFRDYLYIPLGGNRSSFTRWIINIFIVFVASGVWHGANWTFVYWGALHGLFFLVAAIVSRIMLRATLFQRWTIDPRIKRFVQVVFTFNLVCLAWVFFRANSLEEAFLLIYNLVAKFSLRHPGISMPWFGRWEIGLSIILILLLQIFEILMKRTSVRDMFADRPWGIRWGFYYAMLLLIIFLGIYDASPFIYFQF